MCRQISVFFLEAYCKSFGQKNPWDVFFRVKHHWPWHPVWSKQVWPTGLVCIGAMSPTPIVIVLVSISSPSYSFIPKMAKKTVFFFGVYLTLPHEKPPKKHEQNTKHHGKEHNEQTWTNITMNSRENSDDFGISSIPPYPTGCIAFRRFGLILLCGWSSPSATRVALAGKGLDLTIRFMICYIDFYYRYWWLPISRCFATQQLPHGMGWLYCARFPLWIICTVALPVCKIPRLLDVSGIWWKVIPSICCNQS